MLKVSVMGAAGRMGRRILYFLSQDESVKIVGALEIKGHSALGKDAGLTAGIGKLGVKITADMDESSSKADVIVDFTAPKPTLENAEYAASKGKAMVIGTTGFTPEEQEKLEKLSQKFPCVIAPNMSVGVNVVFEITKLLARALGDEYDVEIVEAHHKHKLDSPSGTAIMLGRAAAEGLGRDFDKSARYERFGRIGERRPGEIGIQSVRGGDVAGEHTVMFLGDGERVELVHRAQNRDNFARGVVRAVKWVFGKPPGPYTMKDVLGL